MLGLFLASADHTNRGAAAAIPATPASFRKSRRVVIWKAFLLSARNIEARGPGSVCQRFILWSARCKKAYETKAEQTTWFFRLSDIVEVAENRVDSSVSLKNSACYDGIGALYKIRRSYEKTGRWKL